MLTILSPLILTTTLQVRYYYHSHFIVEEIKSLSDSINKEKKNSNLSWFTILSGGNMYMISVRKKENKILINAMECVNL